MILHGGPDAGPPPRYDFSTNQNALGPYPPALAHVREAAFARYPEPSYRELRARLGDPARIVVGAGASELIHRLVAAHPGPVLVLCPTFGEYAHAARAQGRPLFKARSTGAFLDRLGPGVLAFLALPNNPTGELPPAAFLEAAARRGGTLVLDLAYAPLSEAPVPEVPGALRLYSPNKALGLPGVRGAYLEAPPAIAEALRARAPSWVLGAAGVMMLFAWAEPAARAWVRGTLPTLFAWRRALAEGLLRRGYVVREGRANFLMARLGPELPRRLREKGIKVRTLEDKGLPDWARLAALGPEAREALFSALEESDG